MSCENCEESAYVIDKLAKLLAEIAVIVNGPEPPLTSWSYHDLPEKVRALKQAPPAAAVPAGYSLRDYFAAKAMQGMLAAAEPYNTGELARYAYEVADAMLAAAERKGAGNE